MPGDRYPLRFSLRRALSAGLRLVVACLCLLQNEKKKSEQNCGEMHSTAVYASKNYLVEISPLVVCSAPLLRTVFAMIPGADIQAVEGEPPALLAR